MNKERKTKAYAIVGVIIVVLIAVGLMVGTDKETWYRWKLIGTWYREGEKAPYISFNNDDSFTRYNPYYDEYGELMYVEKEIGGLWKVVIEDNENKVIYGDRFNGYVGTAIIEEAHVNRIVLTDEDRIERIELWDAPHI